MSLKFNAKTHRYWLDGKPVQGVTTLIKGGLPAPQLVYWSARTVAEYVADNAEAVESLRDMGRNSMVAALKEVPWTARDRAGVRGTEVHALAEQLVHGEAVEVPEHIAGHVEACARFLDTWQPVGVVVEKSVGHRAHWWAGRPDLMATLPDGRLVCFDWKTSKGIYPETAYQLAAYTHAEFWVEDDEVTEHPLPGPFDLCAAVHLRADGYDVVPVDGSDETYKAFRHLAYVANVAKKNKTLVGEPIQPPSAEDAA